MRKASSATATTLVVLVVAALLVLAIGPRILGYQTHTMLTGSMAPMINPGDVAVTLAISVDDIRVGDVVTYDIPVEDRRTVTHRVVEILTDDNGATAIRTKGDANPGPDYWTAVLDGPKVDRYAFTIPYMGTAIRTLREPAVLNVLLYGVPAGLAPWMLISIWRRKPAGEGSEEARPTEA